MISALHRYVPAVSCAGNHHDPLRRIVASIADTSHRRERHQLGRASQALLRVQLSDPVCVRGAGCEYSQSDDTGDRQCQLRHKRRAEGSREVVSQLPGVSLATKSLKQFGLLTLFAGEVTIAIITWGTVQHRDILATRMRR